jgi:glutaminyl-tRNA synthetase
MSKSDQTNQILTKNLPDDYLEEIEIPNKPRDETMGTHIVPFTKIIYIDSSDFRKQDEENYYRLAPGKSIGLLNIKYPIKCTGYKTDEKENIIEIYGEYENNIQFKKPKTYIQWISKSEKHESPVQLDQVRIYDNLFIHSNPYDKELVPNGWLSDINPNSLIIKTNAISEIGILKGKIQDKYQFLRIGYFCIDQDSDVEKKKFIVNRTVSLKEDNKKSY